MPEYHLTPETVADTKNMLKLALAEDIGIADLDKGVDCTTDSVVPENASASAAFVSRDSGVVCGLQVAELAIAEFANELKLDCKVQDGDLVQPQQTLAVLSGPAQEILVLERTCLNFMCRLSGVSSLTRKFVDEVKGTKAKVLDTRKTTPGWRRLEKYAVECGGGTNHRMGLYDAVMIKDNHLAFYRSLVEDSDDTIPKAVELARKWIADHASTLPNGNQTILQLEVDSLEQLKIALPTNPDIILLDNMSLDELTAAVALREQLSPEVRLEASGGVNLSTVGAIAKTGVERISSGALTHSATNFDIGLDWTIAANA